MDIADDVAGDSDATVRKRPGSPLSGPVDNDYDSTAETAESSQSGEPYVKVMQRKSRRKQLSAGKNSQNSQNSQTAQSQVNNTRTTPTNSTSDKNKTKNPKMHIADNAEEPCPFCDKQTAKTDSVQCEACRHWHHLICCGVPVGKHDDVTQLVSMLGWACGPCRSSQCELLTSTSKAQAVLQAELKALTVAFNDLLKNYQRGKGTGQPVAKTVASTKPSGEGSPQAGTQAQPQPHSDNQAEGRRHEEPIHGVRGRRWHRKPRMSPYLQT